MPLQVDLKGKTAVWKDTIVVDMSDFTFKNMAIDLGFTNNLNC